MIPCEHEQGEFISPIFLRDKNDGSHRLILNLKGLNKYLEYKHFKMQTFQSVLSLIQPDCFMATIDLKDAYYSVKIDELDTKYLKFLLNSRLLKFVVLPNGLSPGPRKFNKLTKPPLALFRIQEHTVATYIDDIISVDDTFESFLLTVIKTIKLFQSLGFVMHPEKSKFILSEKVECLGFAIDSERMVTYLFDHKKKKIYDKCQLISKKQDLEIRDVASFIGTLTLTFAATEYGSLYYRAILKNKDDFLKANKGNFNARIDLTKNALQEIKWWENNIFYAFKLITKVRISKVIYTDVSLEGWGASYGNTPTGGA